MHLCVENVQDPEVVTQAGDAALREPSETGLREEPAVSDPISAEPKKTGGNRARWFGFSKSRSRKIPHIVHVNLDGFSASLEQMLNPKLGCKPVLIGPRIITGASFEAKLCGVKTGMTIREALSICPKAIVVPGQYDCYAEFAECVRRILESYTPAVETGTQDDFYLNFSGTEHPYSEYEGMLRRMQHEILCRAGLNVAIGAGRSKVVASTASRLQLAPGLKIVAPGEEEDFLGPLPAEKIEGIGQVHGETLAACGVATVGELRQVPKPALQAMFGEAIGKQIWERARGLDGNGLWKHSSSECISRKASIESGGFDRETLAGVILYLTERVGWAVRENARQVHTVGLQVGYVDDFSVYEAVRLSHTSDEREMLHAVNSLFSKLYTRSLPVRLIGVTAKQFEDHTHPRKLADKEGRAYPSCGVDSCSSGLAWNVCRVFG